LVAGHETEDAFVCIYHEILGYDSLPQALVIFLRRRHLTAEAPLWASVLQLLFSQLCLVLRADWEELHVGQRAV